MAGLDWDQFPEPDTGDGDAWAIFGQFDDRGEMVLVIPRSAKAEH